MSDPRFSIVVPTHFRPALLRRSIASVLAQTFAGWELLIVNDGDAKGVDGISEMLEGRTFRVIETAGSQGVSVARNVGIEQASGEFVCFLDDDDEFAPSFLERMDRHLETRQLDFAWSGIRKLRTRGKSRARVSEQVWRDDIDRTSDLRFVAKVGAGCGLALRRDVLKRVGGFDAQLRTSEDRDLFLRLVSAGCRYAALPEACVIVHSDAGQSLSRVRRDAIRAAASARDDELLLYRHASIIGSHRALYAELLRVLAGKYSAAGDVAGFERVLGVMYRERFFNLRLSIRALRLRLLGRF